MNKRIGLPALALLGGILGFGIRKWQLATAFEVDTGLPVGGSMATILLILLTIGMVVIFGILSPNRMARGKTTYYDAFCAKGCPVYAVGSLVAVIGVFVAGGLLLYQGIQSDPLLLTQLILGVACLVSAVSMFLVRRVTKGYTKPTRYLGALLIPAFMACLWLVISYQSQAANPVVLDYIFGLLAIICLLLGLYEMAGFSFEKPKVWGMCVCSLLGFYLTLVTLADVHVLWEQLLLIAVAIYLLVHTIALMSNVHTVRGGSRTKQEK